MTVQVGLAEIWYRRDPLFMPDPNLEPGNLEETHAHVHNLEVTAEGGAWGDALDTCFRRMQGEVWSSQIQARPILFRRGIHHTSMSVGDVVIMPNHKVYECVDFGWRAVGWLEKIGNWTRAE